MGFDAVRDLYLRAWEALPLPAAGGGGGEMTGSHVTLLAVSLFDVRDDTLVSVEIGVLVGTVYSCISHATPHKDRYPRADRVRSNASALWLARAGVRAFEVGTTAQYYVACSGYRRSSREEFVALWRARARESLDHTQLQAMLTPCRRVHSLLTRRCEYSSKQKPE
jgi:hypothetical protein